MPAGLFEPGPSPSPSSSLRPHADMAKGLLWRRWSSWCWWFAVAVVLLTVPVTTRAFFMRINDMCGDELVGRPSSCAWLSRSVMCRLSSRWTSRRSTCCTALSSCASPTFVVMGCWRTFLLRMAEAKDDLRTLLKVDFKEDFKPDPTLVLGGFPRTRRDVVPGDGCHVQPFLRLLHPLTCSGMASPTGLGRRPLVNSVHAVRLP